MYTGINNHQDNTWQLTTDDAEVQFKEYQGDMSRLQKRLSWYHYLRENGVLAVAKLLRSKENKLIKEIDNTAYYGWHQPEGEPFSGYDEQHLSSVIISLASIHTYSRRYGEEKSIDYRTEWHLPVQIQVRLTDLLVFSHKISKKRLADDFQKIFQENFDFIYDQGQEAIQKIIVANCQTSCQGKYFPLVDSFLPENIIIKEGMAIFLPSAGWTKGPIVQDLAGFLLNYLGLHKWDPDLAYSLIKLYEEHNPLKIVEKHLLLALMRYPARFWLYSCQYQRRERDISELVVKLIDLIHEIPLRDYCLDRLDILLSGGGENGL